MGKSEGAGLAALPMYDWPELQLANDRLWAAIVEGLRDRGLDAPPSLIRERDPMDLWLHPDLFLAQTCGLPYTRYLRGQTDIVATPCYEAEGCKGPFYCSVIVVRRESDLHEVRDLVGRTAAINAFDSQSGFSAFRAALSVAAEPKTPIFRRVAITGSHRQSILKVAEGEADVASIDAVAWSLARRHEHRAAAQLRVLGETRPTAGLPLITRRPVSADWITKVRAALDEALVSLDHWDRDQLLLTGFEPMKDSDYDLIAEMDDAFSPVLLAPNGDQVTR